MSLSFIVQRVIGITFLLFLAALEERGTVGTVQGCMYLNERNILTNLQLQFIISFCCDFRPLLVDTA